MKHCSFLYPWFLLLKSFCLRSRTSIRHSVPITRWNTSKFVKLLRCASYFQLSSQCFIWWWNTASHAWYISSTGCNIGGRSVHKNWTKPRKLSTALSNHGDINLHYFLSFLVSCILFLFQYHFQKCRMNKNRVLTDLAKEKEQSMNFETSLWIKSKIFNVWLK